MERKISIIILAYKEPEKFKKMFETLLKNTHQDKTPFEIIIIDNNCDAEIRDYLNECKHKQGFTVLRSLKNLGTSKGFNIGAETASGHYLCFFNSDYYMIDGWLESMIDCFEHEPNIGLISCCTNITGNIDERHTKMEYKESECAIAQMFTTKDIWDEVNGFSEEFFFGFEDLDFNEKIKEKGYKVFVNGKTFGYHDHDPKIKALDKGHQQMPKSRAIFRKKWGDKYLWA